MFGFHKYGKGIGLERIARFLRSAGHETAPLADRSLVVTGSNGKGSTALFATKALEAAGFRVGLFTSPHLVDVRERFYAAGEYIPRDELDALLQRARDFEATVLEPEGDYFGEFEVFYLAALLWFDQLGLDYVVWEAGIGGRYDPVRMSRAPVAMLTSVELEHTDLLGATRELIAFDKLDAARPGGTVIVSQSVEHDLYARIRVYCQLRGITPVFQADAAKVTDARSRQDGTHVAYRRAGAEQSMQLSMIGAHQGANALTALLAVEAMLAERPGSQRHDRLVAGIEGAIWPGRLERIGTEPEVWIDVGHTPDALRVVIGSALEFLKATDCIVVFGVSANKEVAAIAGAVAANFKDIIVTRAHKNGSDPQELAKHFSPGQIRLVTSTIEEAAAAARTAAMAEGKTVLVLGGLFLAIEFREALVGRDPRRLTFF